MHENYLLHRLPSFKGALLDNYLANGWYRYGAQIFSINSIIENEIEHPIHWLRFNVDGIKLSKSSRDIIKRNSHFKITVRPFTLTAELELLHQLYFNNIQFETTPSLAMLLEDIHNRVYDTFLVEVRDQDKLIGAGIFDVGKNSIAGIKNIFDPAYKNYSLGKFIMLVKLQFCLNQKIRWYYPGYIAPTYSSRFDYKLFMDKNATGVFIPSEKHWVTYESFIQK
jgi:arginine-tRNA-protein transferase